MLNEIKNAFNKVSLAHVDIEEFYHGTSYDVAVSPKTKYPIVFLETPYSLAYDNNRKFKTASFALLVLLKIKQDDVNESHNAASIAEDIGDAIISKIQNDYKSEFIISNVNGLSLDSFSDDYLGGIRFEMTVTVARQYAIPRCYEDKFEKECTDC